MLLHDIKQQLDKRRMERVAAKDFVEDRVDAGIAKLDESVHLGGGTWLAGEVILEFLLPGRHIEPKPVPELMKHQFHVHGLKMVGNQLGNHGKSPKY